MSDPRVLAILRRHGWDATSFQTAKQGFSYWFEGDDAFVAYVDVGRVRVVAGAPVAARECVVEIARAFAAETKIDGREICFFGVEKDFVDALGWPKTLVGLQPTWDPSKWSEILKTAPRLREQLRRARAKKVRVRKVAPSELAESPLREQIARLADRWLNRRGMAPMAFVVGVEPFAHAAEKKVFVATQHDAVVGMVALAPLYARGYLIEDLLRHPSTPNGTTELLIDAAMTSASESGARYVTLGLAPLAGEVSTSLRYFRDHASILFDFKGLEAFKRHLRPTGWDEVYIARSPGISSARAIAAVLRAFARGSFVRFGIQTLRRGPPIAIWTLAVALVPWTMALASFDAEKWFPAIAIRHAWVAFDMMLAAAMLALATRWRAGLALLLALVVTMDTTATWVETALFNASRIHSLVDALLVAAACVAPALAATVLWGSWLRRSAHR